MRGAADFLVKVEFLRIVIARKGLDVLGVNSIVAETQGQAGFHRADPRHWRVWRIRESEALARGRDFRALRRWHRCAGIAAREHDQVFLPQHIGAVLVLHRKTEVHEAPIGLLAEAFLPSTSKVPLRYRRAARCRPIQPGDARRAKPMLRRKQEIVGHEPHVQEAVCQPEAMSPPVMRA